MCIHYSVSVQLQVTASCHFVYWVQTHHQGHPGKMMTMCSLRSLAGICQLHLLAATLIQQILVESLHPEIQFAGRRLCSKYAVVITVVMMDIVAQSRCFKGSCNDWHP